MTKRYISNHKKPLESQQLIRIWVKRWLHIVGEVYNLKIQVSKYAITKGIQHESALNWWNHHVLMKRNRTIFHMKQHSAWHLKRTHKFGLEQPKIVKEVVATNNKNGNTLWQDAIQNKMENKKIGFWTISESKKSPNGFHYVNCHMEIDK